MKAHLDIDADLLAEAMRLGDHHTKREAVQAALHAYIRWQQRQRLLALRGKVQWVGDLDEMRNSRV